MRYSGKKALVKITLPLLLFFGLCGISCNRNYHPVSVQYEQRRISPQSSGSKDLNALLQPYADSVNKSMNKVIGEVAETLEKKLPESSLGNLMADAILNEATRIFNTKVDVAFMNYGGIRLNQLTAGPLTIGKVYELMPFDNLLVIQHLRGTVLQQLLDHIAGRGGWPCSGITYQIKEKKAVEIKVGGLALDTSATYIVANSDFIANGGDDCEMLRKIPQENKGYLIRDGLLHYFSGFTSKGEKIRARTDKRVSNAD
jgi:2',3'-cyclic-nucleotide 2'-phosphodiesterase (5'-nucleotidase family)